ncbi:hypothetical protein CYMTET_27137 [Cymbomonas tetramitiformis]|uniref:Uncharacterized protein n=1 Tax=Cymbomonas tetramitiformis TaxID=36881 RepID=A0AAE0FQN6_9CHLO|nr:hypothetical protein CYMTET_27137 [Cymbomonas tetramitiformis]
MGDSNVRGGALTQTVPQRARPRDARLGRAASEAADPYAPKGATDGGQHLRSPGKPGLRRCTKFASISPSRDAVGATHPHSAWHGKDWMNYQQLHLEHEIAVPHTLPTSAEAIKQRHRFDTCAGALSHAVGLFAGVAREGGSLRAPFVRHVRRAMLHQTEYAPMADMTASFQHEERHFGANLHLGVPDLSTRNTRDARRLQCIGTQAPVCERRSLPRSQPLVGLRSGFVVETRNSELGTAHVSTQLRRGPCVRHPRENCLPCASLAVVGNSGSLLFGHFGPQIDSHNVVLRFNQVPVEGYARHVGRKTTFRMLNSLWTSRYALGKEYVHAGFNCQATQWVAELNRDICIHHGDHGDRRLPQEKGATFITSRSTGKEFDELHKLIHLERRHDNSVLYLSPRVVHAARRLLTGYRVRLCQGGRGPYNGGSTPSSGFVAIFFMMNMCKTLRVYGFGNYKYPGKHTQYHYYDGLGARTTGAHVHSWEVEQLALEALAREGRIKFCVPVGTLHQHGSNFTCEDRAIKNDISMADNLNMN